jgi:gamma-glutamylcyclotransferase (GGCT)/AIG2-like uncharacterized protein YtfP
MSVGRRIILQGGYVFDVEHKHAAHLDVLEKRANAYPRLVRALRDLQRLVYVYQSGVATNILHTPRFKEIEGMLRGEDA